MATKQQRLNFQIDVFEKTAQRAQAMPTLTAPELITAILQEFSELEYLSNQPDQYELRRADGAVLDNVNPLQKQTTGNERLVLVEKARPAPADAQAPSRSLYLREQSSGQVYKLNWLPAIIGRADRNQPANEWLAVNLESFSTGGRVSRRHAQITEDKGEFYLESLADNPTFLRRDVLTTPVTAGRQRLQPGDVIILERSYIALKFLVREE